MNYFNGPIEINWQATCTKKWAPFNQKNENNEYVWTRKELESLRNQGLEIVNKAVVNKSDLDIICDKKTHSMDDRKAVLDGIVGYLSKINYKIRKEFERREKESTKSINKQNN